MIKFNTVSRKLRCSFTKNIVSEFGGAKEAAEFYRIENERDSEVIISCDLKMGKILPHWGQSAQPGKKYYYKKIMRHFFGIVDSSNSLKGVYVVDETVAVDKDSDHVCSVLFHYL